MVDYYQALSVSRTATNDEIDRAFRKIAVKLHPDRNKDPEAAAKFQTLSSYRDALKDPLTRAEHDCQFESREASRPSRSRKPSDDRYQDSHHARKSKPQKSKAASHENSASRRHTGHADAEADQGPSPRGFKTYYYRHTRHELYEVHTTSTDEPRRPRAKSKHRPEVWRDQVPRYDTPQVNAEVILVCNDLSIQFPAQVLEEKFPHLARSVDRSAAKIHLAKGKYDTSVMVRLVSYATGKGCMDKGPLSSYVQDDTFSDIEDLFGDTGENSVVACKLYTKMYNLACEFGMPGQGRHILREGFLKAWFWGMSGECDTWEEPYYDVHCHEPRCPERKHARAELTRDKCDLARFVYRNTPIDDRGLRDAVLRTMDGYRTC